MKTHVLLLLLGAALVAVVSATSPPFIPLPGRPQTEPEPECTGDSRSDRWRKDCNWCTCRDGRGTCTRRLCAEGEKDDQPACEGNPTWKDDCNTCSCVDGQAVCTSMYCGGEPGPVGEVTIQRNVYQCVDGSRWRKDCNWCFCEEGRGICTEAACIGWSEAKAVAEGTVECHGDSRWKADCNWCTCVNGRGVCTAMACLPPERDPYHNLPDNAVCVPGSRWLQECNWCSCGENGIARCTLRACIPGYKHEGPTCEGDSQWRQDCNNCRCINGTSVCSKRLCPTDDTQRTAATTSPQQPQEQQCQGEGDRNRWRQDCNWCRCRNGVAACTRRLCPEGQEEEGPVCEGNVSWKDGCNTCRCVNGTAVCTSAFCGPLPARPVPAATRRVEVTREPVPECEAEGEGGRWRQDCNWCRCRNGVGACTRRLCREGQTDDAPECEGQVSWKKDCNRCHCVEGQAICTSAFCGPLPGRPVPAATRRVEVTSGPIPECEAEGEGGRWRQDCNWCSCRNGVGACTRRLCAEGQTDDAPECEGQVSWKKDCNRCHCVEGRAICTSEFCGELPPRQEHSRRIFVRPQSQCKGDPETDSWVERCNRCTCRNGVPACTRRACREGEESLPICEGNPSWRKDCNLCTCVNGTAVCTTKHCGGSRNLQRTSGVKVEEAVCEDGSRWRVDCNWCSCRNGLAACTKRTCPVLGVPDEGPQCEGNSTWKDDCNWCTCGDGKAVCTRMACQRKTNAICTEGTSWRDDCNICRCSQGFVMCTKRACIKRNRNLPCQGDSCEPTELPELCSLPPVSGKISCTAFIMKWTFDKDEGQCKQIVYGGCSGTANLFDSQAECEAACPAPATPQTRRILPVPGGQAASSGGGRCTLPKAQGPCFAAFQRYAYNAETGACEVFLYGGCGGNANNFVTQEECVAACQDTQAAACDKSKCPWQLWDHYLAKECVPQYAGDTCCPTSFQCPSASESEKDPTKCYYRGKTYSAGDEVPVEDPCSAGCRCTPGGKIECANVECPHLFRPPTPGCRPLYRIDSCCPYDYECVDGDTPPLEPRAATCGWQNKTYLEGDKMSFEEPSCRTCVCGPGFTDPNGPGCRKIDCGFEFRYTSRFEQGCIPIHFGTSRCCPIGWMCPDDSRIKPQEQQQAGTSDESAVCRLGDRKFAVGEALGLTDCKLDCRCVTPPELTCIQYKTCDIAAEKACPTVQCDAGCRVVADGPNGCPTCSCSNDTFTCPAQTCPSSCAPEIDLQTGCPSCKCQCPAEVPCPEGCPTQTVLDEATGCPRCECQPGTLQVRLSCPEYPGGRVPCPQDCAVIRSVDENGCEVCRCDPNNPGNPFGPPPPPRPQDPTVCSTLPDGRAPCPMDCAVIRSIDENGCEVCRCDPNNPGNPFGPFGPPPRPQQRTRRSCAGPGQAPCPQDCAVIRSVDENGCEVCQCDPNKPGNPFGPPPPPRPQNPTVCFTLPDGRAPCPQDCAVITSIDENGCEVCRCDPNSSFNPFGPFGLPPRPQQRTRRSCAGPGQAPCPQDCAVIRSVDENGCEVCQCDPNNPGNPFGPFSPPPQPQGGTTRFCAGPGQAPCPQDCAIIRVTDNNGCERCQCDPNNPGNPFGPFRPPPRPQERTGRFCAGPGQAPCPQDCAIIRVTDNNGCERCQCDPNNPGNPFGPFRPPPRRFY